MIPNPLVFCKTTMEKRRHESEELCAKKVKPDDDNSKIHLVLQLFLEYYPEHVFLLAMVSKNANKICKSFLQDLNHKKYSDWCIGTGNPKHSKAQLLHQKQLFWSVIWSSALSVEDSKLVLSLADNSGFRLFRHQKQWNANNLHLSTQDLPIYYKNLQLFRIICSHIDSGALIKEVFRWLGYINPEKIKLPENRYLSHTKSQIGTIIRQTMAMQLKQHIISNPGFYLKNTDLQDHIHALYFGL